MKNLRRRSHFWLRRTIILLSIALCTSVGLFIYKSASAAVQLAEVNPDDWTLETFFLDKEQLNSESIVDLEWDAGEADTTEEVTHVFTLQINYHSNNTPRAYAPGELEIRLDNPFLTDEAIVSGLRVRSYNIGADPEGVAASEAKYDWVYNSESYRADKVFVFRNRVPLEANTNFEGSIQITVNLSSETTQDPELFKTRFSKEYEKKQIYATLNNTVKSNDASFKYKRIFLYDWVYSDAFIVLYADEVYSVKDLGDDANDYVWIKWRYKIEDLNRGAKLYETWRGRYIGYKKFKIVSELFQDDDIKIVDADSRISTSRDADTGEIEITPNNESNYHECYFLAGYPKSKYNDNGGINDIKENIKLYTVFADQPDTADWYLMSQYERDVKISDYSFDYNGSIVGISKKFAFSPQKNLGIMDAYTQYLRANPVPFQATINASVLDDTGREYMLRVGDDILYYQNGTEDPKRLADDNYSFTTIARATLKDSNDKTILCDSLTDWKLFVRLRGQTEYSEVTSRRPSNCWFNSFNLTALGNVEAWYLEFYGLTQPVKSTDIVSQVNITLPDAADNGKFFNFARVEQVRDGRVTNIVGPESYSTDRTFQDIAAYDLATYGKYQQRDVDDARWFPYEIRSFKRAYDTNVGQKYKPQYDESTDAFKGTATFRGSIRDYDSIFIMNDWSSVANLLNPDVFHKKVTLYGFIPKGAIIDSTEEEIINSIELYVQDESSRLRYCEHFKGMDGKPLFNTNEKLINFIKEHSTVTIVEDWRDTGADKVTFEVDFSEKPFTTFNSSRSSNLFYYPSPLFYSVDYHIPYDYYRELGLKYDFMVAMEDDLEGKEGVPKPRYTGLLIDASTTESNILHQDDINENGRTDDFMDFSKTQLTLLPVMSTKQDILTQVKSSDEDEFSVDDLKVEHAKEYDYKLRLRNSSMNRITNAAIYTNIEEAYGDNPHWKGEFLGVDTSFADAQLDNSGNPVKTKVFWSAKTDAKSLSNPEDGWQEYDESTTDKSQVKSLAFQFLDQEGNPAILPQSNYSYVVVKMLAPTDESISTYAYNNSYSEWNPIDNLTNEVIHEITGIESNVVRVYFNDEIKASAVMNWENECDDSVRPETVSFSLMKGDELVEEKTTSSTQEEPIVFEGLQLAERDQYHIEITSNTDPYTVTTSVDGDTLTFSFTLSNTIVCEPDEPDEPDTPDTPDEPDEPGTPDTPDTPDKPDTPNTRDMIMLYIATSLAAITVGRVAYGKTRRK